MPISPLDLEDLLQTNNIAVRETLGSATQDSDNRMIFHTASYIRGTSFDFCKLVLLGPQLRHNQPLFDVMVTPRIGAPSNHSLLDCTVLLSNNPTLLNVPVDAGARMRAPYSVSAASVAQASPDSSKKSSELGAKCAGPSSAYESHG